MRFIRIESLVINVEEITYMRRMKYLRDDNSFGYKVIIALNSGTDLTILDINDDDYEEIIKTIMGAT